MSTERLTDKDEKFWVPLSFVVEYVESHIPKYGMVLEVGSGINNFARANISVDLIESPNVPKERMIHCDVENEPLPFPDKRFDFVYCRHVIEDMWNPFQLLKEMQRVGKAGYIETPSPMAELCRGIDCFSPIYRGYIHHRWMIWKEGEQLVFIPKLPIVEHMKLDDMALASNLRGKSGFWNTHFLWKDKINYVHLQKGFEFETYPGVLNNAVTASVPECIAFYNAMDEERKKRAA